MTSRRRTGSGCHRRCSGIGALATARSLPIRPGARSRERERLVRRERTFASVPAHGAQRRRPRPRRSTRSRSAWSTSRPPAPRRRRAPSPRSAPPASGAASASARSRPWSTRRCRSTPRSRRSPASPTRCCAASPPIEAVLPALAEFAGGAVLVGHNLRFDVVVPRRRPRRRRAAPRSAPARSTPSPSPAACWATTPPTCASPRWPTRSALPHRPSHRALDDVLATADLLHVLLERAAGLGVTVLDDLLEPCPASPVTPRPPSCGSPPGCPAAPASTCCATHRGRRWRVEAAADVRRAVRGPVRAPTRAAASATCCAPSTRSTTCRATRRPTRRRSEPTLAEQLLPPRRRLADAMPSRVYAARRADRVRAHPRRPRPHRRPRPRDRRRRRASPRSTRSPATSTSWRSCGSASTTSSPRS